MAGVRQLHQEIWMSVNGPIPEGYEIHHRDRNTLNNDPDNLACWECRAHHRWHWERFPEQHRADMRAAQPKAILRAVEWHQSAEGLAWHKQHAAQRWLGKKYPEVEHACSHCGTTFVDRS